MFYCFDLIIQDDVCPSMDMVVEFLEVRQMFEPVKNTLAYFGLTRTFLALAASLRQ
jgi:hypothetical protein